MCVLYTLSCDYHITRGYQAIYGQFLLLAPAHLYDLLVAGRGRHLGGAGELCQAEVLRKELDQILRSQYFL